ncbi:MAG: chromosome partitioning protein ParB, partial [Elusimicrobia bacterium]|nr:chromosome partitioning protein ParB [Elusimicrobiota bacterium]
RALLTISEPNLRHAVFQKLVASKLSVRETEALAREMESGRALDAAPAEKRKVAAAKPADLRALEESLQQILGTKVVIRTKKTASKGSIQISFFSFEDFDRILKILKN